MPRPALDKVRMSLDVHPDVKALMKDLQDRLKADSMSEVVRRAVQLLDKQLRLMEVSQQINANKGP